MDIAFAKRSKFLDDCEAAIKSRRSDLDRGKAVRVDLGEGGYEANIVVEISRGDRDSFGTDWKSVDPTRFPARLKAAATALRNCGCFGSFNLSHVDGTLIIRVAIAE